MTESPSPEEVEDIDAYGRRIFVLNMLAIYRAAAIANYAEAEELISRGIELREQGHAMLDRAGQLAYQHGLDAAVPEVPTPEEVDDIPW